MSADPSAVALRLDARALALSYHHGSDTLLVLLDLASRAVDSREGTVVVASYRDIARRMGISKDTVGRRMQLLFRTGAVVERPGRGGRFGARSYRLHLELVGVTREQVPVAA
jgi:DNA-binding IclR family transcriptional regulator